ncbi:MAG: hypothetical protein JO218_00820 [Burkholderiales bacterium]|nr:hypothetical protein [Burkholderiales bacterium]
MSNQLVLPEDAVETSAGRLAWLRDRLASLPPQWVAGLPLGLDENGVYGRYFKCELRSVFTAQHLGTAELVHAELQATGPDGEPFPAHRLFSLAAGADGLLKLDRLCRLIHTLNHFVVHGRPAPLVLSVHPRLFEYVKAAHGRTFSRMLTHFELQSAGIVLSLPRELPQSVLDNYLAAGFTVHLASAELNAPVGN